MLSKYEFEGNYLGEIKDVTKMGNVSEYTMEPSLVYSSPLWFPPDVVDAEMNPTWCKFLVAYDEEDGKLWSDDYIRYQVRKEWCERIRFCCHKDDKEKGLAEKMNNFLQKRRQYLHELQKTLDLKPKVKMYKEQLDLVSKISDAAYELQEQIKEEILNSPFFEIIRDAEYFRKWYDYHSECDDEFYKKMRQAERAYEQLW